MEARRKLNEANAAFVQKAKDVFDRYDTEGSGHVDAWEVKKALKEMGHEISDEIIFSMLRSSETEHTIVNFEKFLTMCDSSISPSGNRTFGKNKKQSDLASAWEAVGGRVDLTGEVDARKLKDLFDLFELNTQVDELIGQDASELKLIDYVEFCSLLETRGEGIPNELEEQPRRLVTPDMRRPFMDKSHAHLASNAAGMESAFHSSLEASRVRTKSRT